MEITRKEIAAAVRSPDLPEDADTLLRLLEERNSCRGFLGAPVPRRVIEQMLSIAQLSASWCNSQPWQLIITEGQGTERFRETLFGHARMDNGVDKGAPTFDSDFPFPTAYRGVYKERQREVGWQLYESVGIEFGDRVSSAKQSLENFRFFGAPHVLLITSERDLGVYGAIDCGLYVGNLLLAAESLGIGIIPQAALATYGTITREFFGIPDNRVIVLGASFGYPDNAHPTNSFRSKRAPLQDVVQWVSH